MITTLKCATNLPEMLFICREYGIVPVLTESLFLGMTLCRAMYAMGFSDKKLALLDSDTLLEVVSYDDDAELLPYMRQRNFSMGYMVDKEGKGTLIGE